MNPFIATAGTGLLVYAAVTIPRNIRKARAQKNAHQGPSGTVQKPLVIDAAAYGLVPAAQLDARFAGPDPHADSVAEAAVAGDWRQAAACMRRCGMTGG